MGNQAEYGIAITASDQTAKGKKAAEKSLGQIEKNVAKASQKGFEQSDRAVGGAGRSMIRTFSKVEKAAARVFGTSSLTSGVAGRLGGLGEAAAAVGSGMGEAAAAGGVLEGALGAVGAAVAATVGVLAAAAYGAYKLADGWARGAASIGRTAEIIGVSAKALQEFNLAAERSGVDRNTAAGAVGGLSQTLNDARYGRNTAALAVLSRLGVGLKLNEDGTVAVDQMLPAIADALQRQNSSGRRTAARALGIPEAALPAFTQGGKALSSDMADASNRGPVISDEDVARGKRLQRRDTIGEQWIERGKNEALGALAGGVETVGDAVISGGRAIMRGGEASERAADKMDRAADKMVDAAGGGSYGRVGRGGAIRTTSAVVNAIRAAAEATGRNPDALLRIAAQESSLNPNARPKNSSAVGLFQFIDSTWLGMMKQHGATHGYGWAADAISPRRGGGWNVNSPAMRSQILGLRNDPYLNALMGGELARDNTAALSPTLGRAPSIGESYLANFLGPDNAKRFLRLEHANPGAGAADYFPKAAAANQNVFYQKNGQERSLQDVLNLLADMMNRPLKIELDVQATPGTRVKAKGPGHGATVAISHAMEPAYQGVHGG